MFAVWPSSYSKFGLAHNQRSAVIFYAPSTLLRAACCASFWWTFVSWRAETGFPEVGPAWCLQDHCDSIVELAPCLKILTGFPTEQDCWTKDGKDWRDLDWNPAFLRAEGRCDSIDDCSRLSYAFTELYENADVMLDVQGPFKADRCFYCVQRCMCSSSIMSYSLQPNCTNSSSIPGAFSATAYWKQRKHMTENSHTAGFSTCALLHNMPAWQHRPWEIASLALLYLPFIALGSWLVMSFALLYWNGSQEPCALWSIPADTGLQDAIQARAEELLGSARRNSFQPSTKDKLALYMDFVLFLLDYFSDWNTLFQLFQSREYLIGGMQAALIVAPIVLDCYRGKIQLVEVYAGFSRSRKKGIPTNKYIMALRSEKAVEAPLSLCLQYYTFLRLHSPWAFWSMIVSMALSVLSITKFAYTTFELAVNDQEATRLGAGEGRARTNLGAHPVVPRQPRVPGAGLLDVPPGLGITEASIRSQGVVFPASSLGPITLGHEKIMDRE